jgi:hypothetical protein
MHSPSSPRRSTRLKSRPSDPFEGSVHSFDNMLNTRDLGSRFLQPHDAEGIGPAAGGTFTFLDQAWMQVSYIQEVLPRVPPPASHNQNRNGADGGVAKGGNRGNTAAPAAVNTQTANRPRRQTGDASAATNLPPAGRGGSAAPDAS